MLFMSIRRFGRVVGSEERGLSAGEGKGGEGEGWGPWIPTGRVGKPRPSAAPTLTGKEATPAARREQRGAQCDHGVGQGAGDRWGERVWWPARGNAAHASHPTGESTTGNQPTPTHMPDRPATQAARCKQRGAQWDRGTGQEGAEQVMEWGEGEGEGEGWLCSPLEGRVGLVVARQASCLALAFWLRFG